MTKSIITDDLDHCYLCKTNINIHIHHCIYGTANRKLSDEYGLIIPLCSNHHNMSKFGVHFNKDLDKKIKKLAQEKFEETYPELSFLKIFGKNYK